MSGFWKGFIKGVGGPGYYMKLTHNYDKLSKLIASYSLAYVQGEHPYDSAVFNVKLYTYYVRTLFLDKVEELEMGADETIFMSPYSSDKISVHVAKKILVNSVYDLANEIDQNLNVEITEILQKGNSYQMLAISNDPNYCKALGLKI